MEIFLLLIIFVVVFTINDTVRKLNKNIAEQTEEIKKLRTELSKKEN